MTYSELREFYDENKEFHDYVMRCCHCYGWSIEQALKNNNVKNYAEFIRDEKCNKERC